LLHSRGVEAAAARPTRIGFLVGDSYPELAAAFRNELSRLGYAEGSDIIIEARFSRSNTTDAATMSAELARMDLALVVAGALPYALEVRKANPTMPMVIATCPGMVSNGFAQTLDRPGGIYTGMDELPPGVTARRLKLLRAAAPAVTRVALLSTTPGRGGHEAQLADAETAAAEVGVEVRPYRAASLPELKQALEQIADDGMNGMLNFQGGLSLANRQLIVDFATEKTIPAIYQATLFAEAGGLMAWAPDLIEQYREAARLIDKILRGSKPGDLPIKHPEKYYLTVNLSAARKIGLTLPPELLAQAARVLE
jgi:putative ABC transport system substrate-binding protein